MATTEPKYHRTKNVRLKQARRALKAEGWGNEAVYCTEHAVVITHARPVEERDAATDYVRSQEAQADEWTEDGPLWLGHALHAAYLAGVDFARQEKRER